MFWGKFIGKTSNDRIQRLQIEKRGRPPFLCTSGDGHIVPVRGDEETIGDF